VLQGSILGPILFLCYINDLPDCSNLKTLLFADDTQGYASGSHLPTLINTVNEEQKKWSAWFRSNKMAVNIKKTKFIIFRSRGKKCDVDGLRLYFADNEPNQPFDQSKVSEIVRVHNDHAESKHRAYRTLGVYFDEHLTLNTHVEYLQEPCSC
jgi:Reverse transcriptase (RNA-dependent DNA polymerase)